MRTLSEIAKEIHNDPKWNNYYAARPYLMAMQQLRKLNDLYGVEDGRSIVLYFLANAKTWRGETARRIKTELKSMLKGR